MDLILKFHKLEELNSGTNRKWQEKKVKIVYLYLHNLFKKKKKRIY